MVLSVEEAAHSNPQSTIKVETRSTWELHLPERKNNLGLVPEFYLTNWAKDSQVTPAV